MDRFSNSERLGSRAKWSLAVFSLLLLISACSHKPAEFSQFDTSKSQGSTVPVMAVTQRKPVDDPKIRFSGGRNSELSFANIDVWVPKNRKLGSIKPAASSPNPSTDFGISDFAEFEGEAEALVLLNQRLRKLPKKHRSILIFIHGYNVSYVEGIYRQAQLIHDFKQEVVGIHYSWPSAGKTRAYLYDRDSVQFARDGLQRTIELAAKSEANSVHIVAHSMGALLTMEAIRQLAISGRKSVVRRIGPLVLASPDIDEDVFQSQIASIKPRPSPFLVLASRNDKALRLSMGLRGGTPRVGQGNNIEKLQELGITVVDLSQIKDGQDSAGHATFANSPTLLRLIQSSTISPENLPESKEAFARQVGKKTAEILFLGN